MTGNVTLVFEVRLSFSERKNRWFIAERSEGFFKCAMDLTESET